MKDELGGKTTGKFVRLRAETYSYLIDVSGKDEKAKDTKNFIKRKLNFKIIKTV